MSFSKIFSHLLALASSRHGRGALRRIQCLRERLPRHEWKDQTWTSSAWAVGIFSHQFTFIARVELNVENIQAELLEDLQSLRESAHLVLEREDNWCSIVGGQLGFAFGLLLLPIQSINRSNRGNLHHRLIDIYNEILRLVHRAPLLHRPFLLAAPVEPKPQQGLAWSRHFNKWKAPKGRRKNRRFNGKSLSSERSWVDWKKSLSASLTCHRLSLHNNSLYECNPDDWWDFLIHLLCSLRSLFTTAFFLSPPKLHC